MAVAVSLAAMVCCAGCAAPAPPLPPTLNLPQVVSAGAFSASRVGSDVRLHWTTPDQTTDKLPIRGPITAEICRAPVSSGQSKNVPCGGVARFTVTPGETDAVDTLPGAWTEQAPELLAYSVQLLNSAGRTAGPSAAVYVAGRAAPPVVAQFTGQTTSAGVELRWQRETVAGIIELDRILLDPIAVAAQPKGGLPGVQKQAVDVTLRAGDSDMADLGGTVDRTVEVGHTYRYTAQRVESVVVGGQTLQVRSNPSAPLTFAVRDVFPPPAPEGLVAIAGFNQRQPAIDLSWEPVMDHDLKLKVAGYKVYRRDEVVGAWRLLGLVTASSYRDTAVVAGQRYRYHVTALSAAGNESAASGEVGETAPQVQP